MNRKDCIFTSATLADVDQLAVLEQGLFMTDHSSRKNLRYLVQRATVIVAKMVKTEEIVGFAILLGRKNSRKKRIYALGVTAPARDTGIGSQLVAILENAADRENCTTITLEVGDSNTAAITFYEKCGFKQHGFRYGYYQDGGHALLMHKNLTE
jgi:ribosomal protein S18 acetylase RimI-like enzyme